MPRPSRCRRVCCEPDIRGFAPDQCCVADPVVLLVEEYECVRLIDLKKRTHDQCARQMQISRTTVTEIYEKARFKIADALINGKRLVIDGGNYRVCQESDCCGCAGRCPRRSPARSAPFGQQGVFPMKVAVPFKNDNIFAHFGMAPAFKVYTVDQDGIAASELVPAGGHGHGAMVNLLVKNGVDTVICGGLGGGAVSALAQAGITLYAGNEGPADEAVRCLIAGRLTNNLEAATAGHGHGHGHGGCGCGCHEVEGKDECCCHGHDEAKDGCCCEKDEPKHEGYCHGHGHGHGGHGHCCGH